LLANFAFQSICFTIQWVPILGLLSIKLGKEASKELWHWHWQKGKGKQKGNGAQCQRAVERVFESENE